MINLLLTLGSVALGMALLAELALGLRRTFHYLTDCSEREP